MVYNNYYFKNEFDCQPYVCNKYHEFSIIVMNLNYFFVLNIKNVEYRVYISGIDKKKAVNILKNSDLADKEAL